MVVIHDFGPARKKRAIQQRQTMRVPRAISQLMLRTGSAETKTNDTYLAGTIDGMISIPCYSTEQVYPLNNPPLGTEIFNRVGRRIRGKSLQIRGRVVNTGNTAIDDCFRVVIVYDRQGSPTGTSPVWADVFTSVSSVGIDASAWAYTNPSNFERFLILADDQFHFPLSAGGSDLAASETDYKINKNNYERFIKLKNLTSHFSSVAAAGALPTTGGIYLMIRGINPYATRAHDFHFSCRYRYTDV